MSLMDMVYPCSSPCPGPVRTGSDQLCPILAPTPPWSANLYWVKLCFGELDLVVGTYIVILSGSNRQGHHPPRL